MKLREIAYSRAGDKGEVSNVCVFAYSAEDWPFLKENLSTDLVAQKFGPLVRGSIARYEWATLCGLNFVMQEALDGGVSISLRVDPHGKTFASMILDIDLPERPSVP